jgi:hypothetical protein
MTSKMHHFEARVTGVETAAAREFVSQIQVYFVFNFLCFLILRGHKTELTGRYLFKKSNGHGGNAKYLDI